MKRGFLIARHDMVRTEIIIIESNTTVGEPELRAVGSQEGSRSLGSCRGLSRTDITVPYS